MEIDLETVFKTLAPFIGETKAHETEAGALFCTLLRALVSFDYTVVFAYRQNERPLDLFSTFTADEHIIFVSSYQTGPYLLDPFYHAARASRSGVWRMRDLAPDRFFSSEYFRSYYSQTRLAEEIGFFVPLSGDITVVLSLMRRERSGPFTAAEIGLVKTIVPVVVELVRHGWHDLGRQFDAARATTGRSGRQAVQTAADRVWGNLNLTKREASIIELVLQGHSSEAIGLRLGISTGTVKVHRRNVYRKLGISSQTQLLSIYLKTLGQ